MPTPALLAERVIEPGEPGSAGLPALTTLAAGALDDAAPVGWVADAQGHIRAVNPEAVVATLVAPGPVRTLHQQGRRLAVSNRQTAWLLDAGSGAVIGTWHDSSEWIEDARVQGPDSVDIYSVDNGGHPTDRSGWRRLLRAGEALHKGRVLASRQGVAPPLGSTGMEWTPADRAAAAASAPTLPLPDRPGDALVLDNFALSWVGGEPRRERARWVLPSRGQGLCLIEDRVLVGTAEGVIVLVLLPDGP